MRGVTLAQGRRCVVWPSRAAGHPFECDVGPWPADPAARGESVGASAVLGVSVFLSSMQLQNWRQSETLFGHALDITPDDA